MQKKVFVGSIIISIVIGIVIFRYQENSNYQNEDESEEILNMENNQSINVIINNQKYEVTMMDNETAKAFKNLIPQEFNMQDLNNNEKYVYLDYTLPTNASNPKQITAGDIMLYGDNCLVIFYKSFVTNYSYTKIGHIDNLPNLEDKNINVQFTKN